MQTLKNGRTPEWLEKVAERFASERAATKLYETLMPRLDVLRRSDADDTREKLQQICADELKHSEMLRSCIEKLDGPVPQTSSIAMEEAASQAIERILSDPSASFARCLEAILTAKLVACDAWEQLIDLTERFDQAPLLDQFRDVLVEEKAHRVILRECLARAVNNEAGAA